MELLVIYYLIAGVALIVLDAFLVTLFLLPLGLSLIATSAVACYVEYFLVHVFVFIVVACFFLFLFQKALSRKRSKEHLRVGIEGEIGYVIEAYQSHGHSGRIRVFDDTWEVYETELSHALAVDDVVRVVKMIGNKVVVEKVH